jgi:hypothetical protein
MITSLYPFPTPANQLDFSPCNNTGLDHGQPRSTGLGGLDMDLRPGSASPLVTDANQDYKGLIFFAYLLKRNNIIYLLNKTTLVTIPLVRVHLLLH